MCIDFCWTKIQQLSTHSVHSQKMDKIVQQKIEIECVKIALRDTYPILNSLGLLVTDKDVLDYIKHIEDDDRQNHLLLAVRKAIDLTETELSLNQTKFTHFLLYYLN